VDESDCGETFVSGYDMGDERLRQFLAEQPFVALGFVASDGCPAIVFAPFVHEGERLLAAVSRRSPATPGLCAASEISACVYDDESPGSYLVARSPARDVTTSELGHLEALARHVNADPTELVLYELSIAVRITSDAAQVRDPTGDAAHRPLGRQHWP
jgi:hypothetical protein